ncbi:PREDICTED: solute carrier family 35 member C2 [Ceratosolen solmsi marchali]|uniref:Solute carrier family 35 member C2 n=1 Tax=Ceratosolen solmsi marchali TaxID=326594 RepID=A0AAJ6VNI7_9HYME|nr:PREDICTED: solute carrier family 35 member C2 [Ceratosolen solmsi marchali]
MPRSNIKYELTGDDEDTNNYFAQHAQEYQTLSKKAIFWRKMMQTIILISVYFVLSIGLTFYQKWLYGTYKLNYPLFVVSCHLVLKYLLSSFIRYVRKCCKTQQQICRLSWQNIVWTLSLPGIASGLDIGFSNWAMSLITMSLYTMTKSTTIIFILGFALLFNLEKKSWVLGGIVFMISSGLVMFTYKSTDFNLLGFVLCLLASFTSGIRWTMAQLIMQKSKLGLKNPVDMIYYMQPWMLMSIFPISIVVEGTDIYNGLVNVNWSNYSLIITTIFVVIGGAILAFSMEVLEFLVVTYGSSLTLSVSGIFKEICILVIAYEWKGDQMSGLNFIGLLMCLGGIILHVIQKIMIHKKESINELELQSNSLTTSCSKSDEAIDTNLPLIMQKSSSLTNLLNANFSSDEDDEFRIENSKELLSSILQRRE